MVRLNVSKADNIFDTLPSDIREHVFSYAVSRFIWKLKTADGRYKYEWAPPRDKAAAVAYGGLTYPPEGIFLDAFLSVNGLS